MNSYLIIGSSKKERSKKVESLTGFRENNPDFLKIEANPSVGIQAVRQLQKFLSLKPYQSLFKAVFIPEADKITIPAQNAFLKTLEEPPLNSKIFLSCLNQDQLLTTIVSRCQLIRLTPKPEIKIKTNHLTNLLSLITKILKSEVGERLKLIEPYTKNREEAIKFCQGIIVLLRKNLVKKNQLTIKRTSHQSSNQQLIIIINAFQNALSLLKSNINVKLVLDNLIINLPINLPNLPNLS